MYLNFDKEELIQFAEMDVSARPYHLVLLMFISTHITGEFVTLPKVSDDDSEVQVSGRLSPFKERNDTVEARVKVMSSFQVELVFCESYSDASIDSTERNIAGDGIRQFNIVLPASPAVIHSLLDSKGLLCSIVVGDRLKDFRLFYKGVQVITDHTELEILQTIYNESPHLLWLMILVLIITAVILVLVPTVMYAKDKRQ